MYSAYTELLTASSAQSRLIQLILKFGEGVIARSIPSEHMAHMRCYRLIYDLSSMSLVANSFVTKRGFSWKPSLSYLFLLTLAHLFRKIGNVFLGKDYLNIPAELLV